jgi:hypothetical protein
MAETRSASRILLEELVGKYHVEEKKMRKEMGA